jgi:hypothetical protein
MHVVISGLPAIPAVRKDQTAAAVTYSLVPSLQKQYSAVFSLLLTASVCQSAVTWAASTSTLR